MQSVTATATAAANLATHTSLKPARFCSRSAATLGHRHAVAKVESRPCPSKAGRGIPKGFLRPVAKAPRPLCYIGTHGGGRFRPGGGARFHGLA